MAMANNNQDRKSTFMDSRGALAAIKSVKGYQMSQNSRVKDLQMPNKQLKFITVNMLSTNLKMIDV